MIAKYIGETTKIYSSNGNELELKQGELYYNIKIEIPITGDYLDLSLITSTGEFLIAYDNIDDIKKVWESESFKNLSKLFDEAKEVVNKEEDDQSTLDIINATYIGTDRNIGDVDLVNNTKYKIRVMCKYPGIIFRVYSDDDFADIMYFSTKEITRKWSGESEFEYLIEQIEKEKSIKQHKLARESRLKILEKAMKDKDELLFIDGQDARPLTFGEFVERFMCNGAKSGNVLTDPTWLKVEVYNLIKKQLKSINEYDLEFLSRCETDTELANYVRGLIDLADSIIKKDDKSIEEAERSK